MSRFWHLQLVEYRHNSQNEIKSFGTCYHMLYTQRLFLLKVQYVTEVEQPHSQHWATI